MQISSADMRIRRGQHQRSSAPTLWFIQTDRDDLDRDGGGGPAHAAV